ncbi:hypothetical protein ACO2CR_00610 [Aeromonas caviae]
MNQIELMQEVNKMKPGQRLKLQHHELVSLSEGSKRSLLFDGPVRESDIDEFLHHLEQNWGLVVQRNPLEQSAIIEKK